MTTTLLVSVPEEDAARLMTYLASYPHSIDARALTGRIPNQAELMRERLCVICGRAMGVSRTDIMGTRRTKEIVTARHIIMYIMTSRGVSQSGTGRLMGGRDHSTVNHAIGAVKNRMETDDSYHALVERVEAML